MPTTAGRAQARQRLRFRHAPLGDRALDFARSFARSKYVLMASFLGEIEETPEERDADALAARYRAALSHGERALRVRAGVTVLLAMGVIAAMATTVVRALDGGLLAQTAALLDRLAAISASVTVLLLVARLACDRYLERVDVTAMFLALQLATTRRPTGA